MCALQPTPGFEYARGVELFIRLNQKQQCRQKAIIHLTRQEMITGDQPLNYCLGGIPWVQHMLKLQVSLKRYVCYLVISVVVT